MLIDRGYDGLVLRELAESLGIKVGNLQYYFATREALALHVLELEGGRDVALIHELRAEESALVTFRMVVSDMAERYRTESGQLLLMITTLAQHHPTFRRLYDDSYAEFYPAFEALIDELRPGLSAGELALRAKLINALVEGSSFQTHIDDLDAFLASVLGQAEAMALA